MHSPPRFRRDLFGIAFGTCFLGFGLLGWIPLLITGANTIGFSIAGIIGLGALLAVYPCYTALCRLCDEMEETGVLRGQVAGARGSKLGFNVFLKALGLLLLLSIPVYPPAGTMLVFFTALIFFPVLWAAAIICGKFAVALVVDHIDIEARGNGNGGK